MKPITKEFQFGAHRVVLETGEIARQADVISPVRIAESADPFDIAGNVREWTCSLWGENWAEPDFRYPYDPGDGREDRHQVDEDLGQGRRLLGLEFHRSAADVEAETGIDQAREAERYRHRQCGGEQVKRAVVGMMVQRV